jgi:hypothetical protein
MAAVEAAAAEKVEVQAGNREAKAPEVVAEVGAVVEAPAS